MDEPVDDVVVADPQVQIEVDYPPEVLCWGEVDTGCREGWDDFDPNVQARATALAVTSLRALTGYRVGGCPVDVRPCLSRCGTTNPYAYGGGQFHPYQRGGLWFNGCGCVTDCSCGSLCEVVLPGMVSDVLAVTLDGNDLPRDEVWRVDDGRRLVRTDGLCWPACQDMSAPADGLGSFVVTFQPGAVPDALGRLAAGLLAHQFALACTGAQCLLPSSVETLTRGTTTYKLAADQFAGGLTGIREVDVYVRRWNPHGLAAPSTIWSPDVPRPRRVS